MEVLIIMGFMAYIQLRPMVVEAVTIEAGTDVLNVEEFLLYKNRKGSFLTEIKDLNLENPGNYEIKIKIGNRIHTSNLQIVDTVAPTATVSDLLILRDELVEAKTFVTNIIDATDVTVSYLETPDTSIPGEQEVTLILEDSSKNRTQLNAKLDILDIKNTVSIEAGSRMDITTRDFVDDLRYEITFVTDLATLDISKPTVHRILINVNGRAVYGNIEVNDTTPPKATISNRQAWKDEVLPALSFVTEIVDFSEVTAAYKVEPDFTRVGTQEVTLFLEDAYGNFIEKQAILTVKADTEPPKILGTRDKTVYEGDGVAYRKGISVTDNKDTDLEVKVDSSAVNLKKVGIYNVIYTAEDLAGNKATVQTTVTVIKFVVSEDMVNELADEILAKIVKNDMTKLEIAEAIYSWIKKNVGYTGDSDKTDWLKEAYRAMEDKKGDCFTFYAVSQALLTRAGIDNMCVTRVGGKTKHFWNLVNCGDGWYHFDSCPNKDHLETFMLTDKELDDFAELRGSYYYNRDESLYPATPEE
jgi:transglutaminase-like putative cysteine protease